MNVMQRGLPVFFVCSMLLLASCAGAPPEHYIPYEPPPPTPLQRIAWWLPYLFVLSILGSGLVVLIWHRDPTSFWWRLLDVCLGVGAVAVVIRLLLLLFGV
jgi:hypothetical protein